MNRLGTPAKLARKPAWGWLYTSAASALVPFVLVVRLVPEGAVRTLLEVGAVGILIGVLLLWVRANRMELEAQGRREGGWRQATLTAAGSAPPASALHSHSGGRHHHPQRAPGRARAQDGEDLRHEGFVAVPRG
jgi:hypothetical protein